MPTRARIHESPWAAPDAGYVTTRVEGTTTGDSWGPGYKFTHDCLNKYLHERREARPLLYPRHDEQDHQARQVVPGAGRRIDQTPRTS